MALVERFLKYVSFDTQSSEETEVTPSTPGQMVFAKYLKEELESLGLEDITLDEHGYLFATLPANIDKPVPTIGFIAHMDTSPDMSGKDVSPRIVQNYDGSDIVLCAEENVVLSPSQFPELLDHKGEDLIVTNGKTLLGADDKAGIAEIVTAMEYLLKHPEIKHGKIRIAFNPDEEIGKKLDDKVTDAAMDELVTTGELNKSIDGDSQDIEAMIADLKKQLADGKLKDESQIKDAIKEAAKDYDLKLSDDDIAKLTSLLMKLKDANIDWDSVINQAQDWASKLGDKINDPGFWEKLGNFFMDLWDKIKSLFS